ncbi:hypothetical protein V2H45_24315, partial [Tumidithrix elongata RA019]|nr:hypothetical protein [Tumidithrix elongata RA019]
RVMMYYLINDSFRMKWPCVSDRLIWVVKKQLYRHGLRSNDKKEKHYAGKQPRRITGVIITSKGELKVPNRQHLKIYETRKLLYSAVKPEKRQKLIQRLKGLEAQAKQIIDANSIMK